MRFKLGDTVIVKRIYKSIKEPLIVFHDPGYPSGSYGCDEVNLFQKRLKGQLETGVGGLSANSISRCKALLTERV